MNSSTPLEHIRALSVALQAAKTIDAPTRAALSSLQHEIDAVLGQTEGRSLIERLEKMAVQFENEHPTAGRTLRQAIDALAKAGM